MSIIQMIHVPKTGGTSASQSPLIQSLNHTSIVDKPGQSNPLYGGPRSKNVVTFIDRLKGWRVTGIVRNPYIWLVSYAGFAGCFKKMGHYQHYDYPHAKKGFEYLVKTIMNREEPWPSRKFIFTQFWSQPSGQFVLDHVFHTEQLDQELITYFKQKHNKHYKPAARKQIGQHKPYRTYYNDKLVEEVFKAWRREFKIFGYDWEHDVAHDGLLSGAVANKALVSYCRETDVCLVKGKPFTGLEKNYASTTRDTNASSK